MNNLNEAREREDWETLWRAAEPIVAYVVRSLGPKPEYVQDLQQEGMLRAGIAVRTWDPAKGTFQTYISRSVHGTLLTYLNGLQNAGIGVPRGTRKLPEVEDLDGPMADEEGEGAVTDNLTYADTPNTPHGYGDVGETLQRDMAPAAATAILDYTDEETGALLRALYGLDGPAQDETEIGRRRGLDRRTVSVRIKRATKRLYVRQKTAYVEDTGPLIAGPRYGLVGRRTHLPASRFRGFWNGLVGIIAMGGIWRESTGKVWNDWSWKPTGGDDDGSE